LVAEDELQRVLSLAVGEPQQGVGSGAFFDRQVAGSRDAFGGGFGAGVDQRAGNGVVVSNVFGGDVRESAASNGAQPKLEQRQQVVRNVRVPAATLQPG